MRVCIILSSVLHRNDWRPVNIYEELCDDVTIWHVDWFGHKIKFYIKSINVSAEISHYSADW